MDARTYTWRGRSARAHARKERDSITHEHIDGEGGTAHALTHGEREVRERLAHAHMDRKSSTRKNTHGESTHKHTHIDKERAAHACINMERESGTRALVWLYTYAYVIFCWHMLAGTVCELG